MSKKNTVDNEIQLPFGPPPVLPDVKKQLKEYLLCPERLPIHDYKQAQRYWPRQPNPASLYHFDFAPLGTTLKVDRDPTTGKLLQFREVPVDDIGLTAKNSMSLQRAPGPPDEAVRGSSTNYPFWPGGFSELLLQDKNASEDVEIDFVNNLLTVPPGFKRGIKFKADGRTPLKELEEREPLGSDGESSAPEIILEEKVETTIVNLMSLIKQEEDLLGLWQEETEEDEKKQTGKISLQNLEMDIDSDVAEIIPKEDIIPVLKITESAPVKRQTRLKWAEELDVSLPVTDFKKKIPEMAKTWPFELDTFQKRAILKLEEHCNVFVAAHTSAGKTVVAEYAIALSKKHKTKAIYTSPIKALSNQKYRDFKETFGDVGLITGDFKVNQTAQCLIMTTEILRSMLYCGSEVIRDLEYVIFDEVHYINDSERGHVWEEVLILLPGYVHIVMLSATVPNTLEFADWVGQTKQKEMFVISTLKRPVPLQHYLYKGFGSKSKHAQILIVNKEGAFQLKGYNDAVAAEKACQSTKKGYGPKEGKVHLTQKQEATIWVGLLDHLKKEDKLPVVAFTFSRNRCDQNSRNLRSLNLTTESEKNFIRKFFNRSIQNLKEPDRVLPQIVALRQLLIQGIGVHHSGILPILKEIVEMLFQKGLVKLLFATETFAMGVNMPARTVVFDSIKKFDGCEKRTLLPAEYIQMAGRAGRRGLDETGTVIILCKDRVPDMAELKEMMLGKPTMLKSKFRLTYSMILNLFRVEKISVVGMMSHSFLEHKHLCNQRECEKKLESVKGKIEEISLNSQQHGPHWQPLSDFYDIAKKYLERWSKEHILTQPKYVKELTPGKILLISHKEHINKLGILLDEGRRKTERIFKVLVLCNDEKVETNGVGDEIHLVLASDKVKPEEQQNERDPLWYKMLGLANKKKIFVPDGIGGHTVVTLTDTDILGIVKEKVSVDTNLVIKDWEKRQIPRFRNDPPGQTCSQAVQKLTEFTQNISSGTVPLEFVSHTKERHLEDIDTLEDPNRLSVLEKKLNDCTSTDIANFEQLFEEVFKYKQLEDERELLQYKCSYESLSLFPEFQDRVDVLQELGYIDSNKSVLLKGQVACGMGSHELMITEMVLRGVLAEKQPSEIAALLSCLVFQQETRTELQLKGKLEQGTAEIKDIAEQLECMEQKFHLLPDGREPSFGLVQVVYDWAQGKPFHEIMKLTDIQEGIIVRCIQQLNETLRDVKNAAHIIGDPILKQKLQEASDAIKRDIVFAASLYTSEENPKLKQILKDTEDERLLPVGDE